jgi:phosphohistidine phosphatase
MHLYFLRHGEADWPDWQKSDDARPLNEKGRKEMKKVAKYLRALALDIDYILTSPLPRARQTAEIVADKLELKLEEEESLEPGFDGSDVKKLLQKHRGRGVMIVGHEPDFTEAIKELTGATTKLSKGGVALVEIAPTGAAGRLLWLIPPKLAKARG